MDAALQKLFAQVEAGIDKMTYDQDRAEFRARLAELRAAAERGDPDLRQRCQSFGLTIVAVRDQIGRSRDLAAERVELLSRPDAREDSAVIRRLREIDALLPSLNT